MDMEWQTSRVLTGGGQPEKRPAEQLYGLWLCRTRERTADFTLECSGAGGLHWEDRDWLTLWREWSTTGWATFKCLYSKRSHLLCCLELWGMLFPLQEVKCVSEAELGTSSPRQDCRKPWSVGDQKTQNRMESGYPLTQEAMPGMALGGAQRLHKIGSPKQTPPIEGIQDK